MPLRVAPAQPPAVLKTRSGGHHETRKAAALGAPLGGRLQPCHRRLTDCRASILLRTPASGAPCSKRSAERPYRERLPRGQHPRGCSATGRKDGSEQQRDQDNDDDQRAQSDRDIPAHKALLCMAFVQSAILRRDGSRLDSAARAARGPPLIGEPQSSDLGLPVIRPRQLVARV